MTDRKRIVITVASALALAVTTVGRQWTAGFGAESHVWGVGVLVAYGLAVIGVFFVERWWALLPAVSTTAISLLASAIYQPPDRWASEEIVVTPFLTVVIVIFGVLFQAAFLSLGLVARRIWDRIRRSNLSTATPRGIDR
jgi:hypothetical protein